jgi:hypothetical protein
LVFSLRPALPGALGVIEVDLRTSLDGEADVLGHLLAVVPGDGAPKLSWKGQDPLGHGIVHRLRAMTVRELEKDDVAAVALDEGPKGRHLLAEDQVVLSLAATARSFTSAGHSEIITMLRSWSWPTLPLV